MIPNQWCVVLDSKQVSTKPIGAIRREEQLVSRRDATGRVRCLRALCARHGVALSAGQVIEGAPQGCFRGFAYAVSGAARSLPFNVFAAHQARRVVTTRRPQVRALRSEEHLLQGDRPMVEYRRRCEALRQAAVALKLSVVR